MIEKQFQVTATFSTPADLVREMDRVANSLGISRSEFIRNAIDGALEGYARSGFGRSLTEHDDFAPKVGTQVERRPTEEEWKVLLDWVDEQVRLRQAGDVGHDADRMHSDVDHLSDKGQDKEGQHHEG